MQDTEQDCMQQQLPSLSKLQNLQYEELSQEQMIEEGDYITNIENDLGELISVHKPRIARACPFRVKLQKGKSYLYCTCGHSKTQPFCDGAHRALHDYYVEQKDNEGNIVKQIRYQPLKVEVQKEQSSFLWCGCKRNSIKAGPSCDGNHTRINDW